MRSISNPTGPEDDRRRDEAAAGRTGRGARRPRWASVLIHCGVVIGVIACGTWSGSGAEPPGVVVQLAQKAEPKREPAKGKEAEKRPHDDPLGATQYLMFLKKGGATQKAPENALGKAIERLNEMREAVPKRAAVAPQAKGAPAAFAGGDPVTGAPLYRVAGMPVGPMPRPVSRPAAAPPIGAAPAAFALPAAEPGAGLLPLELEAMPRPAVGGAAAAFGGAAGIGRGRWKWLGPGNVGGRTRAILMHPTNPNIMWVASVSGGIWKTLNAGDTWNPLSDFMANLNVTCLILDPDHPDVLFAGTGEGFSYVDAPRGAGIFVSRDGGTNWTQLPATTGPDYYYVNRLALSPCGKVLLAGTSTGLFRSANANEPNPARIAFSPVSGLNNAPILDVRYHPTDNALCVAGSREGRAYYSTDGGEHWAAATGLPAVPPGPYLFGGRVELTYARANPMVVYASVDSNNGEIYRSDDGGRRYALKNTGTNYLASLGANQGWYDSLIWAGAKNDADLVVFGGVELFRSPDAGATAEQITDWNLYPTSPHADQHVMVAHPLYDGTNNRTVFLGNDGGLYRTEDIKAVSPANGWKAINNHYGVTQFYSAAASAPSGRIIGGTQDNGNVLYKPPPGAALGPQDWSTVVAGDGGFTAADPTDGNYFYAEYIYLQIYRSTDGGVTAADISGNLPDAGNRFASLFIAPFLLDPKNPGIMLAGGSSLWRSVDIKNANDLPHWSSIKDPAGALISAIAAAPGAANLTESDRVWVGHADGSLYRSGNANAAAPTWRRADDPTRMPSSEGRFCTRVKIDPFDVKRVYACFAGYSSENLWRTNDDGSSWTSLGSSLPGVTVHDVAIHPRNPDCLYAATELGVFSSDDGGTTWSPTNMGPANVAVFQLFWMDRILVAVTYGRGLFWIDLSGVPAAPAPPS